MNHSFNTEIAKKYGVDEAIVIENLHFWIYKNKCNEKHFHDGYYWTYNSTRAFKEMFYYWTDRQIDRVLKSLKEQGAILVGNYNKVGYDRTRWFTLTMAVTDIIPFGRMDIPKTSNGFTQNVEPIPYINLDINTDKIWSLYPNKKGKASAMKSIPKLLKSIGYERLVMCIERYIKDTKKTDIKFIQHGSTFFNGGYMDYLEKETVKATKPTFGIVEVTI